MCGVLHAKGVSASLVASHFFGGPRCSDQKSDGCGLTNLTGKACDNTILRAFRLSPSFAL